MNDIDKIKQLLLSEQECNQRLGIELAITQLGWGLSEVADIIIDKLKVCFDSTSLEIIDFVFLDRQVSMSNGNTFSARNGYTERKLRWYVDVRDKTNGFKYIRTTIERNINDENKLIEMFKTDLLIELNKII